MCPGRVFGADGDHFVKASDVLAARPWAGLVPFRGRGFWAASNDHAAAWPWAHSVLPGAAAPRSQAETSPRATRSARGRACYRWSSARPCASPLPYYACILDGGPSRRSTSVSDSLDTSARNSLNGGVTTGVRQARLRLPLTNTRKRPFCQEDHCLHRRGRDAPGTPARSGIDWDASVATSQKAGCYSVANCDTTKNWVLREAGTAVLRMLRGRVLVPFPFDCSSRPRGFLD
jgi:hypothetical protein